MKWSLLKEAAVDVVLGGLVDEQVWDALREGAFAILVLVVRILILLLFPLTVPLIAWMIVHDRRRSMQQEASFRIRVRKEMHQNGPGA